MSSTLRRFIRCADTRPFSLMAGMWLLGLAAVALATGCSWNLFEKVPVREVVFADPDATCIQTLGTKAEAYFSGADSDPRELADCARVSLVRFAEKTRGQVQNEWTQGEISAFFNTLLGEKSEPSQANAPRGAVAFGPDAALSSDRGGHSTVKELFFWKAVLLGGSETRLTLTELNRLVDLLERLRVPLTELRGVGHILLMKPKAEAGLLPPSKSERIRRGLTLLANEVAVTLSKTYGMGPGSLARLSETVPASTVNWSIFQNSSYLSSSQLFNTEPKLELAQSLKVFLVGGPRRGMNPTEWEPLVRSAARVWGDVLTLYYTATVETSVLRSEPQLIAGTLNSLTDSLDQSVRAHGGSMPGRVIEDLIDALDVNDLMPMGIRAQSAKTILRAVLGKLLHGKSLSNYKLFESQLTHSQVGVLRSMILNWQYGQSMVNEMFGQSNRDRIAVATARNLASQFAGRSRGGVEERIVHQMNQLVDKGRPLVRDSQGRLVILPRDQIIDYGHGDLSRLNLLRVLFERGLNGYTRDPKRLLAWPTISSAETQEIFLDVRDVGRDLGIVDIRSLTAGERTFMESNVFLSVSDGDHWLSLDEAIEWFEIVASAGVTADLMHADLIGRGCKHTDLDVFGRERLEMECVRRNLPTVLADRLAHLPIVSRTVREFVASGRSADLVRVVENASRPLGAVSAPTDSSELRALSPILHYLESLFSRYDENANFRLDPKEVWDVYPLIRPFIEQMANDVLAAGRSTQVKASEPNEPPLVVSGPWDHPGLSAEFRRIFDSNPTMLPVPVNKITEPQQAALFSILVNEGKLPEFNNSGSKWIVNKFWDISALWKVHQTSKYILNARNPDLNVEFTEVADTSRILDILGSFQTVGRATKNARLEAKLSRGVERWLDEVNRWSQQFRSESLVLLQCSDIASTTLRTRLRDVLSVLLARKNAIPKDAAKEVREYEAKAAAAQLKSAIQLDPTLRLLCMPF